MYFTGYIFQLTLVLLKIKIMANTYSQIHIQFVFAVKHRLALISNEWKEELQQFITGIFQSNNHKMLQINSMPDHTHIFIGMRPTQAISSLVQNVKSESSRWINDHHLTSGRFAWQDGYGAFSYCKSHVSDVIRYIQNQEIHHRKEKFPDEYTRLLNEFEIDWDKRYIFTEPV